MTISRRQFAIGTIAALGAAVAHEDVSISPSLTAAQDSGAAPGTLKWKFQAEVEVTLIKEVDGTLFVIGPGTVHAIDAETGAHLWQIDVDVSVDIPEMPLIPKILNGVAFFGGTTHVSAIDISTGEEKWRLSTEGALIGPSGNDTIVFFNLEGIHSVDSKTGKEKWKISTGSLVNTGVVVDDSVVFFDGENTYSVDTKAGREWWRTEGGSPIFFVDDGIMYVYMYNAASVYAMDLASGREKWRYDLGDGYIHPMSTMVDGIVYVFREEGIDALDAENGQPRWHVSEEYDPWTTIIFRDTIVLVTEGQDTKTTLVGLDTTSGSQRWTVPLNVKGFGELTVVDGAVFFSVYHGQEHASLYSLDAKTGAELWSSDIMRYLPLNQTVIAGTAYYSLDEDLYALNAETGIERWRFTADNNISRSQFNPSPLLVSNGTLYFSCKDLNVYAVTAEPTYYPSPRPDAPAITIVETPIRAAPLQSGNEVSSLPANTEVFISGTSKESNGTTWWPVITPDGTEGWVDGSMLRGTP